ncbi:MAG: helix-turn-helix domain-containing protein, partial [Pseudonocardia sp.]|nr:helix-turn-helix domain-containing protein [Pseudonocardia sp.]
MDGLTVRLAGSVGVSCGGSEPDGARLPGRKSRRLLALLAAHRGRTVPNEVIVEELWGEAAPLGPVPAIATLVTRLRAALGPDVIRTGPDGYRLGAVRVDL